VFNKLWVNIDVQGKQLYRELIEKQLQSLKTQLEDTTGGAATVELDQSRVGRLSRMDALQSQAMHTESLNRAQRQVAALQHALARLETDEFGLCGQCDEEIAEARLRHNPAAVLCIACAEKKEQSS